MTNMINSHKEKRKRKSIIKYAGIIILSVIVGIEIAYTINYEPVIILEEHFSKRGKSSN